MEGTPLTFGEVEGFINMLLAACEDRSMNDTLEMLQRRGAHMAKVVDDAGVTLGVATLEDVIEELVGEIRDAAHHEPATPGHDGGPQRGDG